MRFNLFICLSAFAVLSACASTPDPAEICSAEWIAPRAEKAVKRIEKRAGSSFRTLSKVSKTWASGKTPGPLQMFALSNAVSKMKKELTKGQGIRDLRRVAKTCNDPELIKNSMRDLMEKQGLSDGLITWMEKNPIYENLVSSIAEPDPISPNR